MLVKELHGLQLGGNLTNRSLIFVGAIALFLSYPPYQLPALSFVAIVPAVLLVKQKVNDHDPKGAFRIGFWYGFIAQGFVLYWMVIGLWHFTPLAGLGYLITVGILGLWSGTLFWFVVVSRTRFQRLPLWAVFPFGWTAMEWAIGHLGDLSFPWLGLGTSLADSLTLIQWADVAGARGIGLWLAWCNVLLAEVLVQHNRWRATLARLTPVLTSVLLATLYGIWRMRTISINQIGTVMLVQPNVSVEEKWSSSEQDRIVAEMVQLTDSGTMQTRPKLTVWPEVAVPGFFLDHPQWGDAISRLSQRTRSQVLVGGLDAVFNNKGSFTPFNAAFFFDTSGNWRGQSVYRKHYLVPVVERVPFVPVAWFQRVAWLRRWAGGFGRGDSLPIFGTALGRVGVIICYESAFENLTRNYRNRGADFLANITNDAWFGETNAPSQHASHLVLRAIETRMGIVRVANDGPSGFLDPLGRTYGMTGRRTLALATDQVRTSDERTIYVRLGDWVGDASLICVLILITASFYSFLSVRLKLLRNLRGLQRGNTHYETLKKQEP